MFAKAELANFLTPNIRRSVRDCIEAKAAGSGQLVDEDRLYANLLSSQPLCFNLFGELQSDLELASAVCTGLRPDRVQAVTNIRFEHSPGRSDVACTVKRPGSDLDGGALPLGHAEEPGMRQKPMPLNDPHSCDVATARAHRDSPTARHFSSFHVAPRLRFSCAEMTR